MLKAENDSLRPDLNRHLAAYETGAFSVVLRSVVERSGAWDLHPLREGHGLECWLDTLSPVKMSLEGLAPSTSAFAGRRANLLRYRDVKNLMASPGRDRI